MVMPLLRRSKAGLEYESRFKLTPALMCVAEREMRHNVHLLFTPPQFRTDGQSAVATATADPGDVVADVY
jgi:hypothetical protein